ncbi:MAG: DUF1294 domain-containing protein [Patescibacteria group bacterium]
MLSDLTYIHWILLILGIYNIAVFCVYGLDKTSASANSRRISEKALLLLALFFGSPGALAAMYFFRHKTKKISFQFWLFLVLFIQAGLVYLAYYFLNN